MQCKQHHRLLLQLEFSNRKESQPEMSVFCCFSLLWLPILHFFSQKNWGEPWRSSRSWFVISLGNFSGKKKGVQTNLHAGSCIVEIRGLCAWIRWQVGTFGFLTLSHNFSNFKDHKALDGMQNVYPQCKRQREASLQSMWLCLHKTCIINPGNSCKVRRRATSLPLPEKAGKCPLWKDNKFPPKAVIKDKWTASHNRVQQSCWSSWSPDIRSVPWLLEGRKTSVFFIKTFDICATKITMQACPE